jgi:hypothetical protein
VNSVKPSVNSVKPSVNSVGNDLLNKFLFKQI